MSTLRPTVLYISKPLCPPWNDSNKNLVRALAQTGQHFDYHVLTTPDCHVEGTQVVSEPIYKTRGAHTPPLQQNLVVLRRLLRRDATALTHFFFAPNLKTSMAAKLCLRLRPRRTVQTVCSTPLSFDRAQRLLFAEKVIVLSDHTRRRFLSAGIDANRLVHIPPAIAVPPPPKAEERAKTREQYGIPATGRVVLYAGDYQFSRAAEVLARAIARIDDPNAFYVLACRIKQEASRNEERRIDAMLRQSGHRDRVLMLNEVPDMLPLIAACDLCVLPAESLYAKMDLPLVLLEAMALELPVVVCANGPMAELVCGNVGLTVPPLDDEALAAALELLVRADDQRRALGQNARRVIIERFAIEAVAHRHEELYREMLEQR